MALWGKKDDVYSAGTISINYGTKVVTGSGTTFATSLKVGDVIEVGAGATFGRAVIASVTDSTTCSIASTQFLSGAAISGVEWSASQQPKYAMQDSNYAATQIHGADVNEVISTRTTLGLSHAGWVGIKTYIDSHGNLRNKSEVLVAMSGITTGTALPTGEGGDADDDQILPDSVIIISAQPSSVGITTVDLPDDVTFSVTAATSPVALSLSYEWEFSSDAGIAYTALSDDSTYSGTDTTGLGVTVTDQSLDGYYYRVKISATGVTTVFSDPAILGVTTV
jgi:hypothetical protein